MKSFIRAALGAVILTLAMISPASVDGCFGDTADPAAQSSALTASNAGGTESLPWQWPVSTPDEQGLDSIKLAELVGSIKKGELCPRLHALLIIRNGFLSSRSISTTGREIAFTPFSRYPKALHRPWSE